MDRLNRYPSAPRNCLRFCQKTSKVPGRKFLRAVHQPSSGTRGPSPSCGFALLSPTSEANRGTLVGVQVSARQTPAQGLSMGVFPTQPDLRGKPRPTFRRPTFCPSPGPLSWAYSLLSPTWLAHRGRLFGGPTFCPSNTRPGPLDGRSPYSARPQRQTEADFSEPPTFCPSPGPLDGRISYSAAPSDPAASRHPSPIYRHSQVSGNTLL